MLAVVLPNIIYGILKKCGQTSNHIKVASVILETITFHNEGLEKKLKLSNLVKFLAKHVMLKGLLQVILFVTIWKPKILSSFVLPIFFRS